MKKSRAVAVATQQQRAPAVSEASAIVQMIERAARDPKVDVEKMRSLLEMRERVVTQAARTSYMTGMAQLQAALPVMPERGRIYKKGASPGADGKYAERDVRSRYIRWEDAVEVLRPVLAKFGFSLSFRIGTQDKNITVTGVVAHSDGHSEETTFALPVDLHDSRNLVQSHASTVSYGKRYTAFALLNCVGSDEQDDDGTAAGSGELVSREQEAALLERCAEVNADMPALVNYLNRSLKLNMTGLADLPAEFYEQTMAKINAKAGKGTTQ